MTVALQTSEWSHLGVRLPSGRPLPKSDIPTALVSGSSRYFLVTPSYDAILDYNCSHSYAITVGLLGDAIASSGPIKATAAPKRPRASRRKRQG
jgi:membrane-bound lytic murein transglycosylase B